MSESREKGPTEGFEGPLVDSRIIMDNKFTPRKRPLIEDGFRFTELEEHVDYRPMAPTLFPDNDYQEKRKFTGLVLHHSGNRYLFNGKKFAYFDPETYEYKMSNEEIEDFLQRCQKHVKSVTSHKAEYRNLLAKAKSVYKESKSKKNSSIK